MTSSNGRLAGTVAVISGGGGGIGSAIARAYVREGARVLIGDSDETLGKAVADELGHESAIFVPLDVTVDESWTSLINTATSTFGDVSVLVNSAGIMLVSPFEQTTVQHMRTAFEVNLLGTFRGIQAVLASMRAAGGGSIINFASIAGVEGSAALTAYGASKGGVIALTKTVAMELGHEGIRVNAFAPGQIATPMSHQEAFAGFDIEAWAAKLPVPREGETSDIAPLAVLLASNTESAYMTGMIFNVDGGMTAGHSAL